MKWLPGPPPEDAYDLYLVILDAVKVRKRYAASGVEYASGEPVAVRWLGTRGKDTLRQTRVDADLVVRHAAIAGGGK